LQANILPDIQEEIDREFSVIALLGGIIQFNALVVLCIAKKKRFSPHYH